MGLGNVAIDIKIRGAYEGQRAVKAAKDDIKELGRGGQQVSDTFMRMTGTVKESWAGISAGVGGAVLAFNAARAAAAAAYDAVADGARANDQLSILKQQVADVDGLLAAAREKSAGIIDDRSLVESLSKFKAFGLEVSKFDDLVEEATKTAIRLGIDPVQALNDLTEGIAKGSAEVLNNVGVLVTAEDVQKRFTAETGKSAKAMDGAGKVAATLSLALEGLAKQNANVEPAKSQAAAIGGIATSAQNAADALAQGAAKLAAFILAGEPIGTVVRDFDALASVVATTENRLAAAARSGATFASGLADALAGVKAEAALTERLAAETARIEAEEQSKAADALQARFNEIRKAADKLLDPALRDEFLEQKGREALAAVEAQTRQAVAVRVAAVDRELQAVRLRRLGAEDALQRELGRAKLEGLRGEAREQEAQAQRIAGLQRDLDAKLAEFRAAASQATTDAEVQRLNELRAQAVDLQTVISGSQRALERAQRQAGGATPRQTIEDLRRAAEFDQRQFAELGTMVNPLDFSGIEGQGFAMAGATDPERDAADQAMLDRERAIHEERLERMRELARYSGDAVAMMKGSSDELVKLIGQGAEAIMANMEAFTGSADDAIAASGRVLAAFVKDETAKAAIMAVSETAAGFAAIAGQQYEKAAMHFVAAGLYGVVAGVSAGRSRGAGSAAPTREREISPISRGGPEATGTVVYNINAPAVMGGEQAGGVQLARLQRAGMASGMNGGL